MIPPISIDLKGISIAFGCDLRFIELASELIELYGPEQFGYIAKILKTKYDIDFDDVEFLVFGYLLAMHVGHGDVQRLVHQALEPEGGRQINKIEFEQLTKTNKL